jgi:selenocysteine-specific elongation factor
MQGGFMYNSFMRYVILGTAGHIDHGKSRLVKALTGIDPDRLKEEKERGITIDLGFADLEYPDGLSIGIVDVPGHEKLVRNMLAGAGGIDMVLLVIAADEGVMPQSREHLHICNLLKIKSGLIAVTKADLVDPEWLELVTDEARGFVRGTFLEGAEVIPVSSTTGENIGLLKEKIGVLARDVEPKPSRGLFRLPVDRVFTLKGFGTVVTGTAVAGAVSVEEQVEILPRGITTRVRGLHSHGKAMEKVHAGQRAAINLQGVEKEDLERGDTVVALGRFSPAYGLDCKVQLLADAPPLKNRSLVHFHLGTSETVARVILYGTEKLAPGESSYCQMRLKAPVVAQAGDRYIVRRFSPLETIGGGEVLDPFPLRRRKKEGVSDLEVFENGSLAEKIAMKVRKSPLRGMQGEAVEGWIKAESPAIRDAVGEFAAKGVLMKLNGLLFHVEAFNRFKREVIRMLEEFHGQNPMKPGMPKEELRARMKVEPRLFTGLVSSVSEVRAEKDLVMLKDFSASLSEEDKERVLKALREKGFQAPPRAELASELSMNEKKITDILKLMDGEGSVRRINDSVYVSAEAFDRMMGLLKEHFKARGEMTVAEFRDLLGTTRKYALPLLEYLDSNRVTLRVGDIRKLLLK